MNVYADVGVDVDAVGKVVTGCKGGCIVREERDMAIPRSDGWKGCGDDGYAQDRRTLFRSHDRAVCEPHGAGA